MLFTLGLNIVYRSIPWYIVTILLVQLLLSLEFLVAFVFLLILLAFLLFSFFFFVQSEILLKLFVETSFFQSSLSGYSRLYLFCKPPTQWSHWCYLLCFVSSFLQLKSFAILVYFFLLQRKLNKIPGKLYVRWDSSNILNVWKSAHASVIYVHIWIIILLGIRNIVKNYFSSEF